ncbi:hypothetical protein [Nocardia camponoti]|uniref:Uncharacterized protein n=1 Tax=Nocardia camponoti TaxID=1616106 RepID=A0A917Q7A2_9NOCA|nr:hypothetical protein [Nocardia camponoti]GGK33183.1 hypothetical protein GCM10011591_01020 [Nocardia camponoti]
MSYSRFALAVAAGCATVAAFAPPASAGVSQLTVQANISVGSSTNYGVGCFHQLLARLSVGIDPVAFYDNGTLLAVVAPTDGIARLGWVPSYEGSHTMTAVQDGVAASQTVQVGRGFLFGYSCVVTGG